MLSVDYARDLCWQVREQELFRRGLIKDNGQSVKIVCINSCNIFYFGTPSLSNVCLIFSIY